jgi:DNA-binding protein WhiA
VVQAAVRQVACIKYLQTQPGYANLSNALQETAALRLQHPDVSLSELIEFTEGEVGKSGLNHRLKKLQDIAQEWGMPPLQEADPAPHPVVEAKVKEG